MDWPIVMITTAVAAFAMIALQLCRGAVWITGTVLAYLGKAIRQARLRIATSSGDNSFTHGVKH
jgi:hypothetical protein